MSGDEQLEYVKRQVQYEIGLYTQRKQFNRRAAFFFTICPATLAAFATVCIGANQQVKALWLAISAMIATGVASILGAWEALFSNRRLWRVNNVALTALYEIRLDIEYREKASSEPIRQDEIDDYFLRLKSVRTAGEEGYRHAVGDE